MLLRRPSGDGLAAGSEVDLGASEQLVAEHIDLRLLEPVESAAERRDRAEEDRPLGEVDAAGTGERLDAIDLPGVGRVNSADQLAVQVVRQLDALGQPECGHETCH